MTFKNVISQQNKVDTIQKHIYLKKVVEQNF